MTYTDRSDLVPGYLAAINAAAAKNGVAARTENVTLDALCQQKLASDAAHDMSGGNFLYNAEGVIVALRTLAEQDGVDVSTGFWCFASSNYLTMSSDPTTNVDNWLPNFTAFDIAEGEKVAFAHPNLAGYTQIGLACGQFGTFGNGEPALRFYIILTA